MDNAETITTIITALTDLGSTGILLAGIYALNSIRKEQVASIEAHANNRERVYREALTFYRAFSVTMVAIVIILAVPDDDKARTAALNLFGEFMERTVDNDE